MQDQLNSAEGLRNREKTYRTLSPEGRKEADAIREQEMKEYEIEVQRREEYLKALADWKEIASSSAARQALTKTVRNLEDRGFLQYDARTRRYDLHPVVRGVASGVQRVDEKEGHGKRIVDHFSSVSHNPYERAETLEDLRPGLQIIRTLLKVGHFRRAVDAYSTDIGRSLRINIESYFDIVSLLRSFFPSGWGELPQIVELSDARYLANEAAMALDHCGELKEALIAYDAIMRSVLDAKGWIRDSVSLRNLSRNLVDQNLLAKALRMDFRALDLAAIGGFKQDMFLTQLFIFADQSKLGEWAKAAATWQILDPMGRDWSRAVYRPGDAECHYALFQFWQGTLQEDHLNTAERLAVEGKSRRAVRQLHWLRGAWRLEQGEWVQAAASFAEAIRMARGSGIRDSDSETGLALAQHHLGQLSAPLSETERLSQLSQPAHRYLAMLWQAIGNLDQAKRHALAAYQWAWADGEPYVSRYELNKNIELLQQLNVPIPNLPPYDPAKDEPFSWEANLRTAIEKLRAEKQAELKNEAEGGSF